MVNDTVIESQTASDAEIAAAAAEAVEAFKRDSVQPGQEVAGARSLDGTIKPLQYMISPADQGSWVMVWELKIDANGEVYGDPTRAPRQQLGLWLQKRREDGGPRFSTEMPARLRAEPTIPCLFNGSPRCTKKFYTRQDMVLHVRGYPGYMGTHPSFAITNAKLLDDIMAKVSEDNPRLAQMAEAIANMEDNGMVSIPVTPQPRTDSVDVTAGRPTVSTFGVARGEGCTVCDWKFKPDWNDQQRQQFLHTHTLAKHKDEI